MARIFILSMRKFFIQPIRFNEFIEPIKSLPRCDPDAFRFPLVIILSNKLIVMPVQIFIMNQLTRRFSIESISRKHFPICRNNRRAFRIGAEIRIELFTEKQLLVRMFVVCINVYYKTDKFL